MCYVSQDGYDDCTCVFTGETAASGKTLPAVSTEPQQQISQ